MIRKLLLLSLAGVSCSLAASQPAAALKSTVFDCESWAEGEPPEEVFVVEGDIKIARHDGGKAIKVEAVPIVDATAQVGDSAAGASVVEVRVFASRKGRSVPRFGISVHGMSGHRLLVNCAKKQLDLVKSDEVIASAPFVWTTDKWTHLKLSVTKAADGSWQIEGKAWAQDAQEPAEPLLRHQEPEAKIKGNGKAAIWGTPYSETPIYFDDIKVGIEVKAE